jgi:hypothetical protein
MVSPFVLNAVSVCRYNTGFRVAMDGAPGGVGRL